MAGQARGELVLDLRLLGGLGTNERLDLSVDVGDDGIVEVVRQRALAVAPHRHTTSGYRLELTARFARAVAPAGSTTYGASCGARLTGTDTPTGTEHRLRFDVTGGFVDAPVLFAFGLSRTAVPIGSSGCTLHTNPFAWALVTADAVGNASLPLSVSALNGVVQVQAFPFDPSSPTAFRASDGLELTFRD